MSTSNNTTALRKDAQQIIQTALQAVNPEQAMKTHLKRQGNTLLCGSIHYNLADYTRLRVIGFGKGSAPMALAVRELLADKLSDGLVIVKYKHTLPQAIPPISLVEAGHPVPDENSLKHSQNLLEFIADSQADDLVLCLISGGGSALLTQPLPNIKLADIQSLTSALLRAGATINQINTIRKHLSQVKGGKLAQKLAPATTISLILSDVGGDPLDIIASGPTVADPGTYHDALAILREYKLLNQTPASILQILQAGQAGAIPETPKADDPAFAKVQNQIIANNTMALQAAQSQAEELGYSVSRLDSFVEGEASKVARDLVERAVQLAETGRKKAFLFGGETTVTLHGDGLGGRNQEMALAAALHLQNKPNILIACFATDGNDGPTPAAGAFADGNSVARGTALGLDAQTYLNNNDSYHFLEATGDLIITGPSNTNVNDLALVLVG